VEVGGCSISTARWRRVRGGRGQVPGGKMDWWVRRGRGEEGKVWTEREMKWGRGGGEGRIGCVVGEGYSRP